MCKLQEFMRMLSSLDKSKDNRTYVIVTSSFPTPSNESSGIFIYLRVLELQKSGFDVRVYLLNSVIRSRTRSDYSIKIFHNDIPVKVEVINCLKIPRTYLWLFKGKLYKQVSMLDRPVVLAHFAWDGNVPRSLKNRMNIPFFIFCHGSDIHSFPQRNIFFRNWTRKNISVANGVIYVSEYLKILSEKQGFESVNSVVIPNGIRNVNKSPNNFLSTFQRPRTVLYVGHFSWVKGADRLPGIVEQLSKQDESVNFVFIGDGPLRRRIESRIKRILRKDSYSFIGRVSPKNIPCYMANARVLMVPSRKEGFGMVVNEAQTSGCAVVAASVGALPGTVGYGGFIVPDTSDIEAQFANYIFKALNHNWDRGILVKHLLDRSWSKTVYNEIDFIRSIVT